MKRGAEVYLVGGFIRDKILNRMCEPCVEPKAGPFVSPDRDLVVVGVSAESYANFLGKKHQGTVVLLDPDNQIFRVALKNGEYFDITETDDLLKDAKRRDFTINSIYQNFESGEIFDPYDGQKSIENKIIKTVDIQNLNDDPLRMLRAFRFAATLGFAIDNEILDFISQNAALIQKIAPERVHYELIKMFEGNFLVENLRLAHKTGLLAEIFPFIKEIEKVPPNTHHHLSLIEHSIETVKNLSLKTSPVWAQLRIAALMHDIGKPICWKIEPDTGRHRFIGHDVIGEELAKNELKRLKFSRKEIDFISKMVVHHIYPSALMAQEVITDKAKIRFIKKLDPYVFEILDLARADRLSAQGVAVTEEKTQENLCNLKELSDFYEKIQPKLVNLPKLLNGNEIMELLQISAGVELGEVIAELQEAQLEGKVSTKDEAIEFVKIIQQSVRTLGACPPDLKK